MNSHTLLISVDQLQEIIQNQQLPFLIFDCRFDLSQPAVGYEQFIQGHIPHARYVDLEKNLSGPKNPLQGRHPLPTPMEWAQTRANLGISENTVVILYDFLENTYSARMWWMLKAVGHQHILILDGGYSAWLSVGGEVEVGEGSHFPPIPVLPPVVFEGLIKMVDIQKNLLSPSFTVLDARASERFRGDVEPLDPIAGHIPGALNRPYKLNLNQNKLFKSALELQVEFNHLQSQTSQVVHQCGSGVTACHNLLAMELAGIEGSLLYAGSWSEWCHHPENPIALGDA